MASRLYETLNNIELGRKNCIRNAKLANLPATDNMDIYSLGNLFLQQNNDHFINPNDPTEVGTDGEHGGWTRPTDWWDTKTILSEAESITQSGTTYYPAYIMLLADWDVSTQVTKTTSQKATRGDAFIFSDEPDTLYVGNTTHTWDTTKDKPCSLGYKTRYIIVYITNKTTDLAVDLRVFKLIECIFGEFTSSNFYFSSNYFIKNFETLDTFLSTTMRVDNSNGFNSCFSLANINLPNLTTLSTNSAFNSCYSLTSINLPNLTTISGVNAFTYCSSLANVNLPNLRTISGSSVFQSCTSLANINLPNLTTISGSSTFNSCYSLTSINLPNLTMISGTGTFNVCSSLTNINLPNVISITSSTVFQSCYSLDVLTLPSTITEINSSQFNNCINLKVLNLPNDWNFALNTSPCNLTRDCMLDIISKLKDLTGETSKTFTFGATNLANLTAAEIAVGTAKNWVLN